MGQENLREAAVRTVLPTGTVTSDPNASRLGVKSALVAESIGLLPAASFSLRTGRRCGGEEAEQGLRYFENELIAVPAPGKMASSFSPGTDRCDDIASWASTPESARLAHPSLVWMGSPSILENAILLPGGRRVRAFDGGELDIKLAQQRFAGRAYANCATAGYFQAREIRMRGAIEDANGTPVFVARTIWPKDFSLDSVQLTSEPVKSPFDIAAFVRQPSRQQSRIEARLLWERHSGRARDWLHMPVLSIVLNGAQGDNESLGGHFAVATGRIGDKGDWFSWVVNNFYSLDSGNEKGIIAATVPMDNYLMDVNSGQQYYRPSYMMVAVLNNERTAIAFQGGVQRVFNHFYRGYFRYRYATANCAGISMDVFNSLGWHIPKRGPSARLKSFAACAYVSLKAASLARGRKVYECLNEEQTRLLPAVAFEATGFDLLQIVGATGAPQRVLSRYEEQLRSDVEAILLVRIPQVPSGRAPGSAPAFSFHEFSARLSRNQVNWKTVTG